jgi:hypothetical protein
MTKQTKEKEQKREAGPKFKSVIPDTFRIRRPESPMAQILREAESPANPAAPEIFAGQETVASPASEPVEARQIAAPEESAAPATLAAHIVRPQPDLLAGLPAVKGYLRLYYQLIDHLLPQLSPPEAVVYLHLYRLSWGFNKPVCHISNPGMARRAGISERSVRDVTARLIQKKLIEKVGEVFGAGKEQGITYRVAIPAGLESIAGQANTAGAATIATNKEVLKKKDNKVTVCDLCKGSSGMVYRDPSNPSLGVKRCTHGQGD